MSVMRQHPIDLVPPPHLAAACAHNERFYNPFHSIFTPIIYIFHHLGIVQ